jgi:hypothetical protein
MLTRLLQYECAVNEKILSDSETTFQVLGRNIFHLDALPRVPTEKQLEHRPFRLGRYGPILMVEDPNDIL